jgi:hypothetical protein
MRLANSSSSLRSVPKVTRSSSQHTTSQGIEVTESRIEGKSYSSKLKATASSSTTAKSNLSPKSNKAAGAAAFNKSSSHNLRTQSNGSSKSPKNHSEPTKSSQAVKIPAPVKDSRSRSPQKRGTPTSVSVGRAASSYSKSIGSTEAILGTLSGSPKKQSPSRSKSPKKRGATRSKSPKKRGATRSKSPKKLGATRSSSPAKRSASNQPRRAPAASKIKTRSGISSSPSNADQSNGNLRISWSESARLRKSEKVGDSAEGPSIKAKEENRAPTTIASMQAVDSSEIRDQPPLQCDDTLKREQIPKLHCEEEGVEIVAVIRTNTRSVSLIEGDAAETEVIAPAQSKRKGRRLPFFLKTKTPDRKVDSREAAKKNEAMASNISVKSKPRQHIVKETIEKPVKTVTSKHKRAFEKPPELPMSPIAGTRMETALAAVPTSRIRGEHGRPEDVPASKISLNPTSTTASKDSFDSPHIKVSQPGDPQHPAAKESFEASQGRERAWKIHHEIEESVGAVLPRTTFSRSTNDSTAVDNTG